MQSRETTFLVQYVKAIKFAKILGGLLPSLPVPGCGPECHYTNDIN